MLAAIAALRGSSSTRRLFPPRVACWMGDGSCTTDNVGDLSAVVVDSSSYDLESVSPVSRPTILVTLSSLQNVKSNITA